MALDVGVGGRLAFLVGLVAGIGTPIEVTAPWSDAAGTALLAEAFSIPQRLPG